ncbi:MAG: hypothetical protein M3Y71_03905 [Actinomycetota bacterium]|nr:hypothetical protein [Actinomycetota bacterium]
MYPPLSPRTLHAARPSLASRRRASVRLTDGLTTALARPKPSARLTPSAEATRRALGPLAAPASLSFDDWMRGEGLLSI